MMNSFEIFAGAGGLAKGLEDAGYRHSAFVDFNVDACKSLTANFHGGRIFCGDIRDFNLNELSNIDLVAGGPPCQPFSLGGKHKANDDARDMFPYAIHAIERLAPKAFVFENVKGLLRSSFANYFEFILLRLTYPDFTPQKSDGWRDHLAQLRNLKGSPYSGLSYRVQFKLMNAADYGVPQKRERVVIVGIRSDIGAEWAFPVGEFSEHRLLWDMYVTGEYWKNHGMDQVLDQQNERDPKKIYTKLVKMYGMLEPEGLPWQTVRDVLRDSPDPRSDHGLPDHLYRGGARSYSGHTGSYIDWPSKTIKAGGHGVPGGENMIRFPDGSVRYLTVFEAKRVQTFPDEFVFAGAWGEAMRQIGNAVPVKLASVIGTQLWKLVGPSDAMLDGTYGARA